MISTEILAINAIFIAGLYVGFKIKTGIYNLKEYLVKRKENLSNLN